MAVPLSGKLEMDQPFRLERLNKNRIEALETLQNRLLSLTMPSLPTPNGRYTLDTNTYDRQVWYVIMQEQPERQAKPVEYWSQSRHMAEHTYDTTRREFLAVKCAVLLLRPYLE